MLKIRRTEKQTAGNLSTLMKLQAESDAMAVPEGYEVTFARRKEYINVGIQIFNQDTNRLF